MLPVENRVDSGQRDVLITATVSTDKVNAEELIVVVAVGRVCPNATSCLAREHVDSVIQHAVGIGKFSARVGRMGHVQEEAVIGANGAATIDGIAEVALEQVVPIGQRTGEARGLGRACGQSGLGIGNVHVGRQSGGALLVGGSGGGRSDGARGAGSSSVRSVDGGGGSNVSGIRIGLSSSSKGLEAGGGGRGAQGGDRGPEIGCRHSFGGGGGRGGGRCISGGGGSSICGNDRSIQTGLGLVEGGCSRSGFGGSQGSGSRAVSAGHQGSRVSGGDHQLGKTSDGTRDELAVEVGGHHGHVGTIKIVKVHTPFCEDVCLSGIPGRHATVIGGVDQPIGAPTVHELATVLENSVYDVVVAEDHLAGGVRAIGLLLINVRRSRVDETRPGYTFGAVGLAGAGHDHEVVGGITGLSGGPRMGRKATVSRRNRAAIERIVLLQRHVDRAVPTLVYEVKTMIKKLTKEGDERVIGRREAFVRGSIRNEVLGFTGDICTDLFALFRVCGGGGGRVSGGVVDNEATNQAGRRILDDPLGVVSGGRAGWQAFQFNTECLSCGAVALDVGGEHLIGAAEILLTGDQIVELAVNSPQTPGKS